MPETSEKILKQINGSKRTIEELETFGLYTSGSKVTDKPEILFARLDVKEVLEKVEEQEMKKEAVVQDENLDKSDNKEITMSRPVSVRQNPCSLIMITKTSSLQLKDLKQFRHQLPILRTFLLKT